MKLKPVEIKNFSYGTVRIVDPSTQGAPRYYAPSCSSETKVAWHVYGFSKSAARTPKSTAARAAEEAETSFCIYLPPYCLSLNGTYIPVEPLRGQRGGIDFYDIASFQGDLQCSVYKDGNGAFRAKLTIGPMQDAIYTFAVCSIDGTAKGISVRQYASGTFAVTHGDKPFDPIVGANNGQQNAVESRAAGDRQRAGEVSSDNSDSDTPISTILGYANCYWRQGGMMYHIEDQESPGDNGFVALKAGATPETTGEAEVVIMDSFPALQEEMRDPAYIVIPLYKVEEGIITVDFRATPFAQSAEVI